MINRAQVNQTLVVNIKEGRVYPHNQMSKFLLEISGAPGQSHMPSWLIDKAKAQGFTFMVRTERAKI